MRRKLAPKSQDANGVDLDMIRWNRKLSLEERFDRYRRAAESVLWLQNARKSSRSR